MYVLAIANQKGGVGKTTSAANIANAAALRGLRVLLVDLDPQGNASRLTDAQPREVVGTLGNPVQLTVSDALHNAQAVQGGEIRTGAMHQVSVPAGEYWSDRLQVAPANQDLAARGTENFAGVELRLAHALKLEAGQDSPDLVLVDCPPTLGGLFLAALYAADGVLLVSEPADSAVEGLPRTFDVVHTVQAARGASRPQLLGIVATNAPTREQRAGQLLEVMASQYGEQLWATVPRRAVVRQAEGAGAPVSAYGRDGEDVSAIYEQVTARILDAAHLREGVK